MSDVLCEALCALLDHLDAGFVVVFPDGKILHANRVARQMMSDGWPIQSINGSLRASSKKVTALLLEGLRHVTEVAASSPSEDCCRDICLTDAASPQGVALAFMKPLVNVKLGQSLCPVALFVTSIGDRGDCALSAIAECFGLTPAEARALHHFVGGGSVAEAGPALGISENTAKTHLQNIFAKTRSSRQVQLIKLVNDLMPPLRSSTRAKTAPAENQASRSSTRSCRNHTAVVRL